MLKITSKESCSKQQHNILILVHIEGDKKKLMKSIQASRIPLCCEVQILIHEDKHQNPYANKQTIK
jgi:hypothetical protein